MRPAVAQPAAGSDGPPAGIGVFEKWLSVWIALCIAAGIVLGDVVPGAFEALASWEYASVNLVVAVLIWARVYPMMVAVDLSSLRRVGDRPKGLALTLAVNWLVKPFTMAALAVVFFEWVFADLIAPADARQYVAGLILLGAAPCTAMVFVWAQMTRGDPAYTLVQVSVNDLVMVFALHRSWRSCWGSRTSRCLGRRCCCRWRSMSSCRSRPARSRAARS